MNAKKRTDRYCGNARLFFLWLLSCLGLLSLAPAMLHAQPARGKHSSRLRSRHVGLDKTLRQAIQKAPQAAQWPDQDYAVLLDTADVTVKPDGTMVARYRQTLKLFNTRARDLAEVSLPYNRSYQSLRVLQARTIQEAGWR